MSNFKLLRKQFLTAPRYTLLFCDRLLLSASAYSDLGAPFYVKLDYDKEGHKLTIRKASVDEALLNKAKKTNHYSAIGSVGAIGSAGSVSAIGSVGSVGSDHRIGGVLELRRLIHREMQISRHFMVAGTRIEDSLVFDLNEAMISDDLSYLAAGE